ncbi:MAG: 2TM domain-containing protein [Silicimonas sp.]|nr:2TM domain-containing protein [Silicimonas sp.]
MEKDEAYEKARKRAEAKLGFSIHLTVFVAIILLLAIINLMTSPQTFWFQWPLMGWGVAIVLHAVAVFIFRGPTVTEKMIEKELNRARATGGPD